MQIKHDVRLDNLSPQMVLAALIIRDEFARLSAETTITSGSEGEHARLTYHRTGDALDFRTHGLTDAQRTRLAKRAQEALGPNYTAIAETAPPHLHVHYNPPATPPIPAA